MQHYGAAVASGELLPPSHPDVLLVRRIGAAVVAAAAEGAEGKAAERLRDVQWEFHVVKASDKGSCYIQHGGKVRTWCTAAACSPLPVITTPAERGRGFSACYLYLPRSRCTGIRLRCCGLRKHMES